MTVYIDPFGHLWSQERAELHSFAMRLGFKRSWFQDRPVLYHYDVTSKRKRELVVRCGAELVSARLLVRLMRGDPSARAVVEV